MTQFHINGFIDLETSNPIGSKNQRITLSGARINGPLEIEMENGTIANIRVGGKTYQEGINYRVIPTQAGGKVIQFAQETDATDNGRTYPSQLQVNIQQDRITIGAINYADEQGKIGNHLLNYSADGSYTIQSVPNRNAMTSLPDMARRESETIHVASNGSYSSDSGERGDRFHFFGTAPGNGGAAYVQVVDLEDDTDRMNGVKHHNRAAENRQNWLNLNADGWLKYDSDNDQNFNAGLIGYDPSGAPTDFLLSRRDESFQRFSAIINGVMGTVNMNCFRDDHWALDSSASFVDSSGSSRTISVEEALTARGETLRRMGVEHSQSDDPNFTCGLPQYVDEKLGLKR